MTNEERIRDYGIATYAMGYLLNREDEDSLGKEAIDRMVTALTNLRDDRNDLLIHKED